MTLLLRPKYLLVYKIEGERAKKKTERRRGGEKKRREGKEEEEEEKRRRKKEEKFKEDSKVWNYEFLYKFPCNCMVSSLSPNLGFC